MVAGGHYHVISRGNNRATIFHSHGDYAAFVGLLREAQLRVEVSILAFCLMPNHFHLVLSQRAATDISRWLQWLLTTFGHRYHGHHGSCGRLWQGRFKAFPIEQDAHLLTVMRYVERNALRAGLTRRAENWPWSSLECRKRPEDTLLTPPPVPLPSDWVMRVNNPQSAEELAALRESVNRQRPFGSEPWVAEAVQHLGLKSSLRPRGRPRKHQPATVRPPD